MTGSEVVCVCMTALSKLKKSTDWSMTPYCELTVQFCVRCVILIIDNGELWHLHVLCIDLCHCLVFVFDSCSNFSVCLTVCQLVWRVIHSVYSAVFLPLLIRCNVRGEMQIVVWVCSMLCGRLIADGTVIRKWIVFGILHTAFHVVVCSSKFKVQHCQM